MADFGSARPQLGRIAPDSPIWRRQLRTDLVDHSETDRSARYGPFTPTRNWRGLRPQINETPKASLVFLASLRLCVRVFLPSLDDTEKAVLDQRRVEVDRQANSLVGQPQIGQKLLFLDRRGGPSNVLGETGRPKVDWRSYANFARSPDGWPPGDSRRPA